MRKALISGASGFVGINFSRRLLKEGWEVTMVDNLSASKYPYDLPSHAFFHRADIRNFMKGCEAGRWQLIIHCAAVVGGRLTIEGDPLKVATDLSIDAEFFNWLAASARNGSKPRKVVYFSSSAVYPVELQGVHHCALFESLVDLSRSRIGMPDQTYGWSKLTGELLAQHCAHQYGVNVVIYRPFSGYGPGQSFDYPFPSIVRRIVNGEDPIVVWGSGKQVRDFIYIDDVVDGVLTTMDKLQPGEVLNLGSGEPVSFTHLAETAKAVLARYSASVVADPTKPEGVVHRVCDPAKMLTYFTPKVSLVEGIKRVAEWVCREQALDKFEAVV